MRAASTRLHSANPLLLGLIAAPVASAEMTMRVFTPTGETERLIPLPPVPAGAGAAAEAGTPLRMTVFPTMPTEAVQRLPPASAPALPVTGADAQKTADDMPVRLRLQAGLSARRDGLRWNIADIDGQPDVLSELSWRRQKSVLFSVLGEAETAQGWLLQAEVGAGTLLRGRIQDSDYDGNGRTQEFSRTIGESDDAGVMDLRIAAGRRLRFGAHAFSASLGYSWHEQNLRIGKVTQVVSESNSLGVNLPPVGTRFDARSSYTATWHGPRLDLNLDLSGPAGWGLQLGYWRGWVDYKGSGHWALREEFRQPESLTHLADGRVRGVKAELSRPWRKQGALSLSWEKVKGRAGPGQDIVHFVVHGDVSTRLNEVVWDGVALKLGVRWAF